MVAIESDVNGENNRLTTAGNSDVWGDVFCGGSDDDVGNGYGSGDGHGAGYSYGDGDGDGSGDGCDYGYGNVAGGDGGRS